MTLTNRLREKAKWIRALWESDVGMDFSKLRARPANMAIASGLAEAADRIDALEADNARLKAALNEIASIVYCRADEPYVEHIDVARRALAGQEEP